METQLTMTRKRALGWMALILIIYCGEVPAANARTFSNEAEFQQAVLDPITVSFDLFSVGVPPQSTLQLGDVSVELTNPLSPLIFGPGPFGFTTNFLSAGVQDGGNNVVIIFPAGTKAAGLEIVSVFPVTVTATYALAGTETVTFSASQVSFLGFADPSGLQSIRISSPFTPSSTPIANIGDITYAAALVPAAVPAMSEVGFLLLALALLLAGWRTLASRTFRTHGRDRAQP
jgi:hypothetical protein